MAIASSAWTDVSAAKEGREGQTVPSTAACENNTKVPIGLNQIAATTTSAQHHPSHPNLSTTRLAHPTTTHAMTNLTLYTLTALLLLDSSGNRILAKYYAPPAAAAFGPNAPTAPSAPLPANQPRQLVQHNPFSTLKEQRSFEKSVLEKVAKRGHAGAALLSGSGATEIQLLDSHLLLSKSSVDVHLVLVAPAEENELMVSSVLSNLWEAIGMLLAGQGIEKRTLLENLDLVNLAVDEAIDDGSVRHIVSAPHPYAAFPLTRSRLAFPCAESSSRRIRQPLHPASAGRDQMQRRFRSTSRVSTWSGRGHGSRRLC